MYKLFTYIFFLSWMGLSSLNAEDLSGFYQTIDKKTQRPTSVIAIYLYQGKYYGRIVATCGKSGKVEETLHHAESRAPGVAGRPYYCGLDIIWSCVPDGKGIYKGHVIDPKAGKSYTAKIWKENDSLILRGELLVFGRNEKMIRFPEENFNNFFPKPNLASFTPQSFRLK